MTLVQWIGLAMIAIPATYLIGSMIIQERKSGENITLGALMIGLWLVVALFLLTQR